jgi:ribosome-binding protein aMBF1 (putative translation factor)
MTTSATLITDAFAEPLRQREGHNHRAKFKHPSNLCVGTRLRIKRTSRGISQQKLSEQLGINFDDVNAYEEGVKRVGANVLLRIAGLMDVRPDYFFQDYTEEELTNCLEEPLQ